MGLHAAFSLLTAKARASSKLYLLARSFMAWREVDAE